MTRNIYEVLGLLGVRGRKINTTFSPDLDEFNLDDDLGRAVLTRTTDPVSDTKPGWTGGHFRNGDKEARVYKRAGTGGDYHYYGWWIDRDNDDGGYSLAFFADSTAVAEEWSSQDVSVITETATYAGGATGLYAIYSTVPKAHESGDFTADVMLEANFDTDRVSGDITNFMVDGRKKSWSVSMQENEDFRNNRHYLGQAVWEIDGTQPNNADRDASEYAIGFPFIGTDGVPSIAGGVFDARNGNARMYGSFGAIKQ